MIKPSRIIIKKIVKGIRSTAGRTQSAEKTVGIKVDIIENKIKENKITKPIVIPNTIKSNQEKKVVKVEREKIDVPEKIQVTQQEKPVKRKLSDLSPEERRKVLIARKKKALIKKRKEELLRAQKQNEIKTEIKNDIAFSNESQVIEEDTSKKKRGRPRKQNVEETEKPKGKRGRPKKTNSDDSEKKLGVNLEDEKDELDMSFEEESSIVNETSKAIKPSNDVLQEDINVAGLDDLDDINDIEDTEENIFDELDDFDEFDEYETINKINTDNVNQEEDLITNDFEDDKFVVEDSSDMMSDINNSMDFGTEFDDFANIDNDEDNIEKTNNNYQQESEIKSIEPTINYSMSNLNSLMTKDKKIVTFVGTSKNGVSFLVNNLAKLFASLRINTAILDMTKNKNSYYIYTDNKEELRQVAYNSLTKLQNGVAEGIKVSPNMTVYTARPNDGNDYSNAENIYSTLVQNHSLVLVDCDFETDSSFFANAQEIYLVQSMDVLTMQPLTAFLRDLLHKGVLEQEKIKIVINKEVKIRNLNSKRIIAGMSVYNDSTMSVLTELFNRDTVKYCCIPFEESVYAKYLYEVAECKFSIKGYSKNFMNKLQVLGGMVYPLTSRKTYSNKQTNSYGTTSFSNDTNEILNKMKKKY